MVKFSTSKIGGSVFFTLSFTLINSFFFVETTSSPSALLTSILENFAGRGLPFILPNFGTTDSNAFVYGCLGL